MSYSMNYTEMEDRRRIKKFVSEVLQDRVFTGRYTERKLAAPLLTYKDVIEIDSKEDEFINTLKVISEQLNKTFDRKFVSCIEASEEMGFSILTNLSDVELGSHSFKIVNVSFNNFSLNVNVKRLRSSVIESEPLTVNSLVEWWNNFSLSKFFLGLICFLFGILTRENIVNTARFLSAVFLSTVVGLYHLLELFLRFFNELNNTLKILQPVFIAGIEGLTKAFGGLLILITYLWKGESARNPLHFQGLNGNTERKAIQFNQHPNYRDVRGQRNRSRYELNNRGYGYNYR